MLWPNDDVENDGKSRWAVTEERRLRVRLYIGGELCFEEWVDASGIDKAAQRHAAQQLKHPGKEWNVEVFDPTEPENEAYLRFGSSTEGMVQPVPVNLADLTRAGK